MRVLLKIDNGSEGAAVRFAEPFDAALHLLLHHCTAEQIQSLRLEVGRKLLNNLEVIQHEPDSAGHDQRTELGSPAADAKRRLATKPAVPG